MGHALYKRRLHEFLTPAVGSNLSWCYVTAPPLTAGLPVPFTAGVMENETRLLSSKRDSTCLEDTLIYLEVNKRFHVCFLKL